ncbi:MAG: response regulator [Clostridia bacterium]|nr:response regulator [Clostridia bacterium]
MYRIIIVDDEALSRIGLKSMIPWESLDCEVLGEACNGEEGIRLVENLQPDIVITDIKMPVMDGLEMIRRLKSSHTKAKFIVLSSYDEFHLVKEAMKLGAEEYLIKLDIDPDILSKTIRSVCEKLFAEAEEDRQRRILDMHARINMDAARKDFLKKLLNKMVITNKDIHENMRHLGIKLNDQSFGILVIEIIEVVDRIKYQSEEDIALLDFCVENVASEVANDFFNSYTFKYNDHQYVIVFSTENSATSEETDEKIEKMGKRLITTLDHYANVFVSVGVSNLHTQIADLSLAFKESLFAAERSFLQGRGKILIYKDVRQYETGSKDVNISRQLVELKDAFDYLDAERIISVFSSVANMLRDASISKTQAHELCSHIAYKLMEMSESGRDLPVDAFIDANNLYKEIPALNTLENTFHWLDNVRNRLVEIVKSNKDQNQNSILIQKAKKYISEHISKEIMLSEVAGFLNMSHCYFSTVFKQITGESFSDYVAKVKIAEAQKLLKKGKYKIYEVAEMTGYENAYYFSRVFKKVTGSTPKEYMESEA